MAATAGFSRSWTNSFHIVTRNVCIAKPIMADRRVLRHVRKAIPQMGSMGMMGQRLGVSGRAACLRTHTSQPVRSDAKRGKWSERGTHGAWKSRKAREDHAEC